MKLKSCNVKLQTNLLTRFTLTQVTHVLFLSTLHLILKICMDFITGKYPVSVTENFQEYMLQGCKTELAKLSKMWEFVSNL